MRIALFGVGLFSSALFVHWLLWRFRIPKRQTPALLMILLGVLPIGLAAAALSPGLRDCAPANGWEYLQVLVFHVALSLAYIVTYSALEEHSPSLTLVKHVAEAGARGRSRAELCAHLASAMIVPRRLEAMVRDDLIAEAGGAYHLTPKGRFWGRVFACWRRLLRIDKGG
jgi:hypothetical protein